MARRVDRQTTTPFLLKLFYRDDSFHRLDDFTPEEQPSSHLQIYTWQTCSLSELTHLLASTVPKSFPGSAVGTRVAFRLVYPDARSGGAPGYTSDARYLARDLGSVIVGRSKDSEESVTTNGGSVRNLEGDKDKTLQDGRFIIGDWVSCCIMPPLANGQPAPAPPPSFQAARHRGGRGGYGGPRENGYGGGGGGGYRNGRSYSGDYGRGPAGDGVPSGDWRRGERVPEPHGPRSGYGRGRGRGW